MSDPSTPDTTASATSPPPGFGLPGEALRGASVAAPTGLPVDLPPSPGPAPAGPPSSRGRAAVAITAFVVAGVVAVGLIVTMVLADEPERPSRADQREAVASSLDAGGDEAEQVAGERPFTAAEITACRADLQTYETAVAAFSSLEGRPPTDEVELVTAGYLDVISDLADLEVVGGVTTVVVQPGAPCEGA